MYRNNIDAKLLKRIQSKEIEEAVDQAVRSFMYDLDYMLLEEQQNKEAVNKFSSPLSGKNLPFSSLSDKLEKNKKKK